MKTICIQTENFFELLKLKNQSMWDIFAQMIDGTPQKIIFLDDKEQFLFSYILPSTLEEMEKDKKIFAQKYSEKLGLS